MEEHKSKYEVVEELAGEVSGLMEELCQSGFATVHDSTLEGIQRKAELAGQYGMTYLSKLLTDLADEISASRHQMEKQTAAMADIFTDIQEYLYLGRQKAAYDRGIAYYT